MMEILWAPDREVGEGLLFRNNNTGVGTRGEGGRERQQEGGGGVAIGEQQGEQQGGGVQLLLL